VEIGAIANVPSRFAGRDVDVIEFVSQTVFDTNGAIRRSFEFEIAFVRRHLEKFAVKTLRLILRVFDLFFRGVFHFLRYLVVVHSTETLVHSRNFECRVMVFVAVFRARFANRLETFRTRRTRT
jgi:hypothetical protein